MAQRLTALAASAEDPSSFPSMYIKQPMLSVTPAPGQSNTFGLCDGLNRNGFHRLIYLNAWSLGSGTT